METIKIIMQYFKERKKYWLYPILIFMFALSILFIWASNSVYAPFIYSLF